MDFEKATQLIVQANTAVEQNDYLYAIHTVNQLIELGIKTPDIYNLKAHCEFSLRNYAQTIKDSTFVIQQDPNSVVAYYNRGCAYFELEQYENALTDLDKTIDLQPNHGEAYNYRGCIKENQGYILGALDDFLQAHKCGSEVAMQNFMRLKGGITSTTPKLPEMEFNSSRHIRYENGQKVGTFNDPRIVDIEKEGRFYIVTILNANKSSWLSVSGNVVMASKRMLIQTVEDNKVVLRGYGEDAQGYSFINYGLTVYFSNSEVEKMTLHLHDRNVNIEYFK